MKIRWLTGVLLLCGAARAEFDFGPVAALRTDPAGRERLTAAGPFYESFALPPEGGFMALRPFYVHLEQPEAELELSEVLWPLYACRYFKDESSWRALIIFTGRQFDRQADDSRRRTWLLPFWFHGEDAQGETYRALFPVGGTIHEFLGRDEIRFVLFPVYGRSGIGDQHTLSLLWPIYSRTTGPRDDRFRIFPLYGRSERTDRFRKKFVLWPFWTSAEFTDPRKPGSAWMLFPLAGHGRAGAEETTYVIPPLFRFSRAPQQKVTNCPWPFFQFAEGEVDKTYLWPLWGRKAQGPVRRSFALWPLIWSETVQTPAQVQRRRLVLPVFYSEQVFDAASEPEAAPAETYWKLWPLMSWRREGSDARFRTLELWPLKETGPIERGYAPLWRLYQYVSSGDRAEQELLWGLVRRQRSGACGERSFSVFPLYESRRHPDAEEREWSLLKGLIGYKRTPGQRSVRLLWFFKTGTGEEALP